MRLLTTDLDGHPAPTGWHRVTPQRGGLAGRPAAGWFVVIATGRPPFKVVELATSLGDAVTHG